ncbi:uncharacterized protein LOC100822528 [Brachypodium distachyon]|uniref:uncharacterized protein LOC100822528 n=1 Tax=Brachypodium distachyon TaxID=15368 RepID=UPI00071D32C3|nr:uncharacterized protein LOC100822528 [Brachypodium distachyon]|eukprot:XP_014754020.1 uncharacterized protein LOC100822528 [Brachypodium distachyon]
MPPKGSPKYPKGISLYPKGSPKYNIMQSKKITKGSSPSVERQRASWNAKLEKDLVELLHEHNNSYHRGQNGWSRESWNTMASLFQERHKHLNFRYTCNIRLLLRIFAGQTTDGKLNFTSTSEPSMEDEEETERGVAEDRSDDEL